MSLIKTLSFSCLIYVLSISANASCPSIDLNHLQCETSDGHSYAIDFLKLDGSTFSFLAFGIPVEMNLPSVDEVSGIKSETYCDSDQVVTRQTFENISVVSVIKFENNQLTIKGQSIATRCEFPEGCRAGEHYFDQFIQEDIVCQQ